MSKNQTTYQGLVLSRFCMQISILLKSAVPLYEGLEAMAEDEGNEKERATLLSISEKLRAGDPLSAALEESGRFPDYAVHMTKLGEATGNLDVCMERLADHYEKEYYLAENLRKAVTYPSIMAVMLLVILFVLFSKVMPVFTGVYESLGTSIPPAAQAAMSSAPSFPEPPWCWPPCAQW